MKIYLDNAATTEPYNGIEKLFEEYLNCWYNPSALYPNAINAEKRINKARTSVALGINAKPDNVLFTSGGTEGSNTIAFKGYRPFGGKKQTFITTAYEHACVYGAFKELSNQGHDVIFVSPRKDGHVHAEDIVDAVNDNTALVSVMHVNNETGAINDINTICNAVKHKNPAVLFHSDGVQAYLRVPFDFTSSNIDYYTVSAHKIHGLKGTGALFYKKSSPLRPLLNGGGQENGLRSGTENTLGIYAFGEAVDLYIKNNSEYISKMALLRDKMLNELNKLSGFVLLSPQKDYAPHILNVSFEGLRGEVLLHLLEREGIDISTGAACSSKKGRSFRIHEHTGFKREILEGAIRISFSPFNTAEEIDCTCEKIDAAIKQFGRFRRR